MKKIVQTTLAATLTMALVACGGSSNDEVAVEPTTLDISGQAIKGTMANATVQLFAANDLTTPIATVQSDANGEYSFNIEDANGDPIVGAYVVRVTADEDTTMICDASACGDVARGETIPAADLVGVSLSSFTYSDGSSSSVDVDVNVLTSMATEILIAEATTVDFGNITPENAEALQEDASKLVLTTLGIDVEGTNLFTIDLIDASTYTAESQFNNDIDTLTLINASFSGFGDLSIGEQIEQTLTALNSVLSTIIETGEITDISQEDLTALENSIPLINQEVADIIAAILADTANEIEFTPLPTAIDLDVVIEAVASIEPGTGATGA